MIEIGVGTRTAWLLGHPVGHSVSPAMHNAAYQAMGLDLVYLAADVEPDGLKTAIAGLRRLGFAGANVTIPHKEKVAALVDELRGPARLLGAVNTVWAEGARLIGYNTDAEGWLAAWDEHVGLPLGNRKAIVLGAGGAARGLLWALSRRDVRDVLVMNRSHPRACELIDELGPLLGLEARAAVLDNDLFANELRPGCVVINTTPLGMAPHPERSPVEWPRVLPDGVVACDLIYNPVSPRFLASPRRHGAPVMGGLGMLVYQAARAIELWTGRKPPRGLMRSAALKSLRNRYRP
ncbi:MAG: shikimate dehydrogenase [Armatimonadetes bacterium]|nr:shikimate dehydrogenase [Armatimonadota bacterium]